MAHSLSCNAVSVRLNENNYPTWLFQMEHHLKGHGLLKFVDGSHPCPSDRITAEDGTVINNSAAVEKWCEQNSYLTHLISNTLSDEALTLIVGCRSALEVWNTLRQRFANVSEAHIMQLKGTLQNIQKGGDSIERYLLRFKSVRDQLAVLGVGMSDQDVKVLILAGLPSEYGHTRQIIRGKSDISLEEVRSLLLSAENEIEMEQRAIPLTHLSAMYANHEVPANFRSGSTIFNTSLPWSTNCAPPVHYGASHNFSSMTPNYASNHLSFNAQHAPSSMTTHVMNPGAGNSHIGFMTHPPTPSNMMNHYQPFSGAAYSNGVAYSQSPFMVQGPQSTTGYVIPSPSTGFIAQSNLGGSQQNGQNSGNFSENNQFSNSNGNFSSREGEGYPMFPNNNQRVINGRVNKPKHSSFQISMQQPSAGYP